jgi:hypothetical protein
MDFPIFQVIYADETDGPYFYERVERRIILQSDDTYVEHLFCCTCAEKYNDVIRISYCTRWLMEKCSAWDVCNGCKEGICFHRVYPNPIQKLPHNSFLAHWQFAKDDDFEISSFLLLLRFLPLCIIQMIVHCLFFHIPWYNDKYKAMIINNTRFYRVKSHILQKLFIRYHSSELCGSLYSL